MFSGHNAYRFGRTLLLERLYPDGEAVRRTVADGAVAPAQADAISADWFLKKLRCVRRWAKRRHSRAGPVIQD